MSNSELENLGETVRKQGNPEAGSTMKDLVFNPVTGEFEQKNRISAAVSSGDVVTEMTKHGFA